jgi:hypothetical protein
MDQTLSLLLAVAIGAPVLAALLVAAAFLVHSLDEQAQAARFARDFSELVSGLSSGRTSMLFLPHLHR